MHTSAKQKKQKDNTQSSELPSSYLTDNVLVKQMSYNPSLVPLGLDEDEEKFCFGADEDTENEAENEEDEDY